MASDNLTQPGVRINERTWERFRQYVLTRHDGIRGHLRSELEAALNDRLDAYEGGDTYDRLRRIEERVEDMASTLESDASGGGIDSISNVTEDRMASIMADVSERADELNTVRVTESDIEAAIERHAGASYKTVERYKGLLQNQRQVFPHPDDGTDVYFIKPTAFIAYMEQNDDVDTGTLNETVERYGDVWWEENAPGGLLDDGRGFE